MCIGLQFYCTILSKVPSRCVCVCVYPWGIFSRLVVVPVAVLLITCHWVERSPTAGNSLLLHLPPVTAWHHHTHGLCGQVCLSSASLGKLLHYNITWICLGYGHCPGTDVLSAIGLCWSSMSPLNYSILIFSLLLYNIFVLWNFDFIFIALFNTFGVILIFLFGKRSIQIYKSIKSIKEVPNISDKSVKTVIDDVKKACSIKQI